MVIENEPIFSLVVTHRKGFSQGGGISSGGAMLSIHPRFIVSGQGCKTAVILSMEEWNAILDELEQLEDIRDYDMESAGIEDISRCRFYTVCLRKK